MSRGLGLLLLLLLLLLAVAPVRALEVRTGGTLTAGVRHYPRALAPGNEQEVTLGATFDLRARLGRALSARVSPRLHWDPDDGNRWRAVPREAWMQWRSGGLRLRAGRQVLSWGTADSFNPTDVASSYDAALDFLEPEKPGEWSLLASYSRPAWGAEVVVLPVLEGARLPGARSPWSIERAARRSSGFSFPVRLDQEPVLAEDAREISVGVRVRRTLGSTDVYLTGYTGVDRLPVLYGSLGFTAVTVRTGYLPLHMVGVEAQSAVGNYVVRGALAYRDQTTSDDRFVTAVFGDVELDPEALQGVVGVERLFTNVAGGPGTLNCILEFVFDDGPTGDDLEVYRPLQRDLVAGVSYLFGDFSDSRLELGWVQDLERAESVGRVRVARKLSRAVTVELGADAVLGPSGESDSPFALYSQNDRFTALFELAF